MKLSYLLFLVLYFIPLHFCEDLYTGLLEDIEKGQELQSSDGPRLIYSDSNPQEQIVKQALHQARLNQLKMLQAQISTLDDAINLPKELAKQRRVEQKSLIHLRNAIASKVVDSVSQQGLEDLVPGKEGITQASQFVHYQARKYLQSLPKERHEEFISSWKAALVDGEVRRDFANLLAMGSLYGADNSLVKKSAALVNKHGQNFEKNLQINPGLKREQAILFTQSLLKPHVDRLPTTLKKRFQSISLFEQKMVQSGDAKEKKLIMRKLEWERERMLQALIAIGLEDPGSAVDLNSLESSLSDFLKDNLMEKDSLVAPIRPDAKVIHNFIADEPFVGFEVTELHQVVAMIKGSIMTSESNRLTLQSMHYYVVYEGDFTHQLKRGHNCQVGDVIAKAKVGKIQVEVYDLSLGNQPINFVDVLNQSK